MPRGSGTSLSVRIVILMVAAVLPLALLGASFGWMSGETAVRAETRARYETARVFAALVETLVQGVTQVANFTVGLAATESEASCMRLMDRLVATLPAVVNAGVFRGDALVCSAADEDGEPFLTQPAQWRDDVGIATGSRGQLLLRIVRVREEGVGSYAVVTHMALADIWTRLGPLAGFAESDVFLLTETGGIIGDPEGAIEPEKIAAVAGALAQPPDPHVPVVAVDSDEVGYVAFARVGSTSMRVAVTSDEAPEANATLTRLFIALLLPLAFLAAAVATAWLGVDRLVNRWIRRMRRTAALYGAGRLSARVGAIEQAPVELQSLARAFDDMAFSVEQRSRDLERAVAEREHFLRELHHRIKNNFQMIASLLSLQRRELRPPIEPAIREAHDRVQALAAAYRVSYADADTNAVPVGALMTELVERLRESAGTPGHLVSIADETEGTVLHLDRAIPLALLITELAGPMFDRVRQEGTDPLVFALRSTEGSDQSIDVVISTAAERLSDGDRPGLSTRLVAAYVAQLGATLERSPAIVSITMTVDPPHALPQGPV